MEGLGLRLLGEEAKLLLVVLLHARQPLGPLGLHARHAERIADVALHGVEAVHDDYGEEAKALLGGRALGRAELASAHHSLEVHVEAAHEVRDTPLRAGAARPHSGEQGLQPAVTNETCLEATSRTSVEHPLSIIYSCTFMLVRRRALPAGGESEREGHESQHVGCSLPPPHISERSRHRSVCLLLPAAEIDGDRSGLRTPSHESRTRKISMSINYETITGRVCPTTKPLQALSVPVGSYSTVIEYKVGMYQDGTPGVSGREPPTPGGGKWCKVLFYATLGEALDESAFVLGGVHGDGQDAVLRRIRSILGKVVQLTPGQLGRMGIGAVEGERAVVPVPAATLGVTGATVDVFMKEKFGEDSMLAANWVDRSAPTFLGAQCMSFVALVDGQSRNVWHATVVGIDESDAMVELRASPGSDVIKRITVPQSAIGDSLHLRVPDCRRGSV